MTSEIPKKPGSGNSHVFVGLAAAMLVATGGLIAWKMSGSSGTDAAPSATAQAVEDERPQNVPPPPPPPPPVEEPSAAPSASAANNAAVRSGKSPCSIECKGEVTQALRSGLAGRGGAGRRCYEKSLAQNATLSGKMTIHVKVAPNGQVCAANVASDSLQDPGLANCILGVFRASTLTAPQGGCVEVDVPLNFVPNK